MLVVRLLGGLTVTDDDVTLAAPRGRCAALLAWLALHPGMQPRARVAARLWPDVMDESARSSLRTALVDLRAALGPDVAGHLLGTRDEIGLGPDVRVDVRDFADAAVNGRLQEALAIAAAGELLPELDHEWVYEARDEHERRLGEVVERLAIDAERRGDRGAAVEYTRRLITLDPLSEEYARSLMRRLALAEDRSAALAVFEQHRERLRSELRMVPSGATRALADEIRDGGTPAPARRAAPVVARPSLPGPLALAAGAGPLVGRQAELGALETAWEAIADGLPRVRLITGEAGIGKSRLIAELAQQVAAAGAPVLYGACHESPRPPYGPFVDAISLDLRGLDKAAAGSRLGTSAGELSRIIPDLRDRFGAAAHASGESPQGDQMRMFAAVGDYLQRAALARALVVIEDIHWAASGTLALLAHIARTAVAPILLVVSTRDVPPDMTSALSTFLSDLGRHPAVQRIGLSGLTEPDVEALLRATAGPVALDVTRTARMLHGATGGSPLFLREVVRELPADGLLQTVPLSRTVRDHVAARFQRLPDEDGAMLDAAAVLGAEFEARACAQVLDRRLPHVLDALDRANAFGIVVPAPGAPGRFAFTHAVLREVRYEAIPAGRRMQLHHAAGNVLRAAGAPVTDLARHFYAAADLGDRQDAYTYARRAGELARERFAFADAAVCFEQAAQLGAQLAGVTEHDLCELAIAHGEALHRAGDSGHRAVLLDAAATARRLDDADLLTRAALALSEQGWATSGPGAEEVVKVARDALERLPAGAAARRARLMAMIAAATLMADKKQASELGAEALAAARGSGDGNVLGEALISAHWACYDPLNLDQRLGWAQEARDLGERLHNPVVLTQALRMLGQDLLESGDLAGARDALDRCDRVAEELGTPFLSVFTPAAAATLAALAGRIDDAERLGHDCSALARRIGANPPAFVGAGLTGLIERGLWERGVATLKPLVERTGGFPMHRAALAMLQARLGEVDVGRRELRHFTDMDFATLPRTAHWSPGMVMLADAATWLRDADAAARIRERLEPVSGRTAWSVFTALWPIDIALAQLSVVLGEHARAHEYLDAAERTCERNDLVVHRVRVALYRAWALRDAGERVDAGLALAAAETSPCAGVAREARLMGLAH
jgi:DNA-binding SARP family transcriptional activator/tetratricopeptide (TPR) repeat protein